MPLAALLRRAATRYAWLPLFVSLLLLLKPSGTPVAAAQPSPAPAEGVHYGRWAEGQVCLKAGQRLEGRVALRGWKSASPYLLYQKRRGGEREHLPLENVKSFRHGGRYVVNHGVVRKGNAAGRTEVHERLVERRVRGRLDLYAPLAKPNASYPYMYFSKEGAPLRTISYRTLRPALADDAESVAAIEASRTWGWLENGLQIGGVVVGFYGATQSFSVYGNEPAFEASPAIFVGAGMVVLSLVPRVLQRAKFRDAIRAYND